MHLVRAIAGLKTALAQKSSIQTVGLVPTMGALHDGHRSLIARARHECDVVVVSIFVNPLQFGVNEDLDRYPRQLATDCDLCESLGVDVVFAPTTDQMYATDQAVTMVVPPPSMMVGLCGRSRSGHFQGVATVVTKLLLLVQPDVAYFGEKDAQQLAIIRRLVADLNLPVKIHGCPIIREASGLALSSRNQYLSESEKAQAIALSQGLFAARSAFWAGERQSRVLCDRVLDVLQKFPQLDLDYLELVDPVSLQELSYIKESGLLAIAAKLGTTRLIDNIMLQIRQPIIAIDGPAGAGKSTVTRQVAEQLGLLFLDTGAMYRAITWLVLHHNIDVTNEVAIAELVSQASLELQPPSSPDAPIRVLVNQQDVTQAIRTPEVTAQVSAISAQAAVREVLVQQQQLIGKKGGIVAEGRDIGSTVFPEAEIKIFLTATPAERARRRAKDLAAQGYDNIDLAQLEAEISHRDHLDSTRAIAPLKKSPEAIELITDGMAIEEVTAKIIQIYQQTQEIENQ